MKKIFLLPAAALLFTLTVSAQSDVASNNKNEAKLKKEKSIVRKEEKVIRKDIRKLEGNEVGNRTKESFLADFGNIPVTKWERTSLFDKAIFAKNGKEMTAYYDADSKLVGTTSKVSFKDIPAIAQKYIDTKYRGYAKSDVIFFDDNELNETDMVMFNSRFDDADNYFVDLKKDNKEIVLKVSMNGDVSFFIQIR